MNYGHTTLEYVIYLHNVSLTYAMCRCPDLGSVTMLVHPVQKPSLTFPPQSPSHQTSLPIFDLPRRLSDPQDNQPKKPPISTMVLSLFKSIIKRGEHMPKLGGYGHGVSIGWVRYQVDREALTVDYLI